MPLRSGLGCIGLAIVVAAGAPRTADAALANGAPSESRQAETRKNRVGVDLGWGSAIGELGLTYGRSLASWLLLEGGVGIGVTGMQLSGMAKVIPLESESGLLFVGLGASETPIATGVGGTGHITPLWFNAELGYEAKWPSGFSFSAALGTTTLLNGAPHTGMCWYCLSPHQTLPTLRLGLGYWF